MNAPLQVFSWVTCPQCDGETRIEFLDGEPEAEHAPYCSAECEEEANPEFGEDEE